MTREEYKKVWVKDWECVVYLLNHLHKELPEEAPKWDDPKLLLYTANLTQLQININCMFDLLKELTEVDGEK